jgi:proline-specific peptidase
VETFRTGDGRTLAFRLEGSGPALVCHPGGPGFSGRELGDLAGIADTVTLIVLDPRGTGGSDPPADTSAYALDDFVSDLEALRVHLGLERMSILGYSHGGLVAIRYAAERPEHVERLVLAATLARFGDAQQEAYGRMMDERTGEPWYGEAVAALEAEERGDFETPEDLERLCLAMAPMYFARWNERARALVEETTEIGNVEALKLFNADPPDLTPELGRITAPTLVIAGEQDFICGPASARELSAGIPDSRLALLADAGHWVFFEQGERFAAAVRQFLSSSVAAPTTA